MTPDRLRIAIRAGIYALVLLAPLPFGSVQAGYVLAIELTAAAIGLAAVALLALDPEARAALPRVPLLLCGVIVALGIVQLVPLPFSIAERFNPTADLVRPLIPYLGLDHPPAVSWSVAAPETIDALLRFVAYLWIGLGAALAFDTAEARKRFAIAVVASAVFQAVYGSGEYVTGRQHIFAFAKKHYLDSATGTFINRNHFATLLAVALPFALALAIPSPGAGKPAAGWRRRVLALGEPEALGRALAIAAAALIWLGLLLSHSRAGLVAALAGAAIVLVHHRRARVARWAAAIGALVLVAILSLELAQAPGERFLSVTRDLTTQGGRPTVWRDALALLRDRPLIGWGLGTFESAFPSVQSAQINLDYGHAHNDWLEWAVEGGVIAALVAGGLLLVSWSRREAAVQGALAAVALHALWDFSLRIPALAVVAAVVVGCASASGARARRSVADFGPPRSLRTSP